MLAGPVRSGLARRPLCARLCLPRGVGLHYVRGAGVAGHFGLSALACFFPVGSDCILLAWLGTSASLRSLVSSLSGRIAMGMRSRRGMAGLVGLSALACVLVAGSDCAVCVLFVCLFVCLSFVCKLPPLVRPLAVRLPVPRVGRSRSVSVSLVSVPSPHSPLFLSPPPSPGVLLAALRPLLAPLAPLGQARFW